MVSPKVSNAPMCQAVNIAAFAQSNLVNQRHPTSQPRNSHWHRHHSKSDFNSNHYKLTYFDLGISNANGTITSSKRLWKMLSVKSKLATVVNQTTLMALLRRWQCTAMLVPCVPSTESNQQSTVCSGVPSCQLDPRHSRIGKRQSGTTPDSMARCATSAMCHRLGTRSTPHSIRVRLVQQMTQ